MGLSMVGAAAGAVVSLYQTGVIRHLPDPPIPVFDSSKVDASSYAYKRFNQPDAPGMLVNYGITAMLTAMGGKDRARTMPLAPIAMAVKTVMDSVTALELGREEWVENRKLCFYCQAATAASRASVALALPEAVRAARHLMGR